MKHISAFICLLGAMLCLCACGENNRNADPKRSSSHTVRKNDSSKDAEDFSNLTGEEILHTCVKDIHSVTSDEYLKVCNALENCSYNETLVHEDAPVYEALATLKSDGTLTDPQKFAQKALKSKNPLIRAEGIEVVADYLDACAKDSSCMKALNDLVNKETDPYVLLTVFERGYHFSETDISDRALEEKGNKYPEIRAETIKFVLKDKTETTKPHLLEYLADADVAVRSEAVRNVSDFDDESLIPYVVEFINTPENKDYYWHGLSVLEDFSRNEPFYDKTSEEAWTAMMDFYNQDGPEGVPSYNDIKILQTADETNEDFIKWRQETPYVDKDEIVNAMYKIVQSDGSEWLDVQEAIRVVKLYGSDAQYKALEEMIQNRTDPSMKDNLLECYHEYLK